jgi:hypothetical protein
MGFLSQVTFADAIAGADFEKEFTATGTFSTIWQANANPGELTFNVHNTTAGVTITIRIVRFNGSQDDYLIEDGDTRSFTVSDPQKLLVQTLVATGTVTGEYVIVP